MEVACRRLPQAREVGDVRRDGGWSQTWGFIFDESGVWVTSLKSSSKSGILFRTAPAIARVCGDFQEAWEIMQTAGNRNSASCSVVRSACCGLHAVAMESACLAKGFRVACASLCH